MQPSILNKISTPIVCNLFLMVLSLPVLAQDKAAPLLLHAARVFDGDSIKTDMSIIIKDGVVTKIQPRGQTIAETEMTVMDLGDATIFPGFIELHAHLTYQNVSPEVVLRHGITTIRDLGGPVHLPSVVRAACGYSHPVRLLRRLADTRS